MRGHLPYDAGARRPGDRLQPGLKWVRLPPASLSSKRPVPSGPRRACPVSGRSAGRVPCRESKPGRDRVVVAQLVEHQVVTLGVTGSTPVHNTPRSVMNRPLRDVREGDSTIVPEGDGRPDRSALVRIGASSGRDGRAKATRTDALKHADSAALRRRRGAADAGAGRGASAPCRRPPKRPATRRPGRLKRGSAHRRVTAGRPVPRRLFLIPRSSFFIRPSSCQTHEMGPPGVVRGPGGVAMFFFKRYTIRSFEMGLHFRDGEFRGLLGAGTHWFFDPLGKVAVEVVSRRAPFLVHEKLDLIVEVGRAEGPRRGARPRGRPAGARLGRPPVRAHPAAGPVRLLDGAARGPGRGGRRPPAAVRARGPEGHRAERVGARAARDGRGRPRLRGGAVPRRPLRRHARPGPVGLLEGRGGRARGGGRPPRGDARRAGPGDHERRQGHAPAERRGDLPRRRPAQGGLHGGRLQAGPLPRGPARAPRRRRGPRARRAARRQGGRGVGGRGTPRAAGRGARASRSRRSASAT